MRGGEGDLPCTFHLEKKRGELEHNMAWLTYGHGVNQWEHQSGEHGSGCRAHRYSPPLGLHGHISYCHPVESHIALDTRDPSLLRESSGVGTR